MTPGRELAVAFAVASFALACGSADDTGSGDTDDTGEPSARSYAYRGSYSGFDFGKATLDVIPRADGGESVQSHTVIDFLGFLAVRLEVSEHAEIDADGRVQTWVQQARHTLGDTELTFRYEVDAATGEAVQGIGDRFATFDWQGQGTPVLYPYPSEGVFGLAYPSPLAGYAVARALSAGHDIELVVPYYQASQALGAVTLPTAGADGVCGADEMWTFLGDFYCTGDDGEVISFVPGAYGIEMVQVDSVDISPVQVDLPGLRVIPPVCDVPAPGDRRVDFVVGSSDGTAIAGRLLLPPGTGPFPAVTINAGTGGSDRTGFVIPNPHWDCIAAELLGEGIAVVTYDDRGHGASGGAVNDSFIGRTHDAAAVAGWATERSELGNVYLLGHSEGVAHVCEAAPGVDHAGLVLVSGVADTGADVFVGQLEFYLTELGFPTNQVAQIIAPNQQIVSQVRAGTYPDDELAGAPVSGFWDAFFDFDGTALALATTGPVLVVQGGMDWQVPSDQGAALYQALNDDERDVTLAEFPALGHLLQPALQGVPAGLEYHMPWSWDPGVTAEIADWISVQEAGSAR